jgi:hypothetical protein
VLGVIPFLVMRLIIGRLRGSAMAAVSSRL